MLLYLIADSLIIKAVSSDQADVQHHRLSCRRYSSRSEDLGIVVVVKGIIWREYGKALNRVWKLNGGSQSPTGP